jgi:phosphoserine phosphatase RsbU/P
MSKKPPAIDAMHPVDKILFPIMIELHGAFSQMREKLADYIDYLKETTSAKEKIKNELSIAQEILLSMTPHSFPPFPNLLQVDLYATLNSARKVGGDFYDSFRMDYETFCFAADDVSGKGVPASLFMDNTIIKT